MAKWNFISASGPDSPKPLGGDDWAYGFLGSAVASIPEMWGQSPSRRISEWRQDNPIAGLTSELLGVAVPYVGWEMGAAKLPLLGKTLSRIGTTGKLLESPAKTRALRTLVKWAPFEGARVGTAAVLGDPGAIGDTIGAAALDLGLFTGGSALYGLWKGTKAGMSAGGQDIQKMFPEYDLAAARPLQIRQLVELETQRATTLGAKATEDEILAQVRARRFALEREVRLEIAPEGKAGKKGEYVRGLEGPADAQAVNRLFYLHGDTKVGKTVTKRLAVSGHRFDFRSQDEWGKWVLDFGMPAEWAAYTQFPRATFFKDVAAARQRTKVVHDNFIGIGNGWFLAKEPEGLYVMTKRARGSKPSDDRWLTFKTDTPSKFVGQSTKNWADLITSRTEWELGKLSPKDMAMGDSLNVYGGINRMMHALPYEVAKGIPPGKPELMADAVLKRIGLDKPAADMMATAGRLRKLVKRVVFPSMFQFSENKLARYIFGIARWGFDHAQATAERIAYGKARISKITSLYKEIWGAPKEIRGVVGLLNKLGDKDRAVLQAIWIKGLTADQARFEGLVGAKSPMWHALRGMEKYDHWVTRQLNDTHRLVGHGSFKAMPGHFMISRTWKGHWRVGVLNDAEQTVYMASGHNPAQAWKEAQEAVLDAKKVGQLLHVKDKEPWLADRKQDLNLARLMKLNTDGYKAVVGARLSRVLEPSTFEKRKGVEGFVGSKDPWSKKELEEIVTSHIYQYQRYLAELSTNHRLGPELMELSKQDPDLYRQLVDRLRDLAGRAGPLARWQNSMVDKVLAKSLGANSATKLVGAINTYTMNFQLGMGNLQFPGLNAVTFTQTVLPHIAHVMTGDRAALSGAYTWLPVAGKNGKLVGGMGTLDPIKLSWKGLKALKNPSDELRVMYERAQREGVVDPRLVEEYVGEKHRALSLENVDSAEGVLHWLKNLSEFLPAQSEKFSRGHAFATGYTLWKDVVGVTEPEKLYHLAREFTNNTMYLYSVADRARMMTGPLGSLFGMFKNWQTHYIAQMMQYSGEAFYRGNFKPLLWMMGGTGLVGGLGATVPFAMADQVAQMLGSDPLVLNLYEMFSGDDGDPSVLADGVFYGLPAFLGVSLQGSSAQPGANPVRDAAMYFSFAHWDRMKYLGQAIGDGFDHWQATGNSPMGSEHVRDVLVRALGPRSLYRWAQMTGEGTLQSLSTGYPVASNFSFYQRMMFRLGFNPTEVENAYQASDFLWKQQNALRSRVQEMGRAWAEATLEGDSNTLQQIMNRTFAEGVPLDSVIKSAHSRLAKTKESQAERQFRSQDVEAWRRAGMLGR